MYTLLTQRGRWHAALAVGLLLTLACQAPHDAPLRHVTLVEETLTLPDSTTRTYERGFLSVPLNRTRGTADTLALEFFRFPRDADVPAGVPPIVLLRGGPGSETMGPLLERDWYFPELLAPYTEIADVIVPGQRGFYTSGATPCDPIPTLPIEEALDPERRQTALQTGAAACRQKWETAGLDLTGFNVKEAAADVVDLARSLGYDQVQLMGVSFGSHWGLTVLRYHPDVVARATFGALEGPDHTYDSPSGILAALERIAAAAEAAPALQPHLPEAGLLNAYRALIDRADATPIPVTTTHPETGAPVAMTLDGDAFRLLARGYSRGTTFRFALPAWPLDLLTMLDGSYEEAAERILRVHLYSDLDDAAYYQIDCASGISAARGAVLRNDPAAATVGATWSDYDTLCEPWDADLGNTFRTAFTSDVPVVLVQGNWDTSTPYENAQELRNFFRDHHFIHVEGGSHGALREANEDVDGFQEALHHWMATGSYEHLPERVDLPPVPWRAPAAN